MANNARDTSVCLHWYFCIALQLGSLRVGAPPSDGQHLLTQRQAEWTHFPFYTLCQISISNHSKFHICLTSSMAIKPTSIGLSFDTGQCLHCFMFTCCTKVDSDKSNSWTVWNILARSSDSCGALFAMIWGECANGNTYQNLAIGVR